MKKLLNLTVAGVICFGSLFSLPAGSVSAANDSISGQMEINRFRSPSFIQQKNLIKTGNRFLGVRYKLGAEFETSRMFDCSSFTQYVYKKNRMRISRGARDQFKDGIPVARKDLQPGDLVFFSTRATWKYSRHSIKRIGHVGIYVGNNKVLHTYGKGGVRYDSIARGWWAKNYIAAVRVKS